MMAWLLIPVLFLAFIAPSQPCPTTTYFEIGGKTEIPPLYFGNSVVPLGTDQVGRDLACITSRGLQHTLRLGGLILLLGFLPGLILGMWIGSRGKLFHLQGEIFLLAGLLLFMGIGAYILVLAIGVFLYVARVSSGIVQAITQQTFFEGAKAIGGSPWHIVKTHVVPHIRPRVTAMFASAFAALLIWMAELAVLGFYSQGVFSINLIGGDNPRQFFSHPTDPDLAQWIAYVRLSWIAQPELLLLPLLVLVILILGLTSLGRKTSKSISDLQTRATPAQA